MAGRSFCRRCGTPLAEAVALRRPWWRRIIPARGPPVTDDRPAAMRTIRIGPARWARAGFLAVIGAVVVGSLLSYAMVPGFRSRVNHQVAVSSKGVQRTLGIGMPVSVKPSQAEASSSVAGHPPSNLIDLISDDYWAADMRADPQPRIQIAFASATDMDYLLVTSGAGADYASLARPKDVQVAYSDGATENLTLTDQPQATKYDLHGIHVRWVAIRILSVYPSAQSSQVAIAELEFFRLG